MKIPADKKKVLLLCSLVLGLVWGFLLIRYGFSFFRDLPDKKKISNAAKELTKVRNEYEKVQAEYSENQAIRRQYRQLASSAWIVEVDGGVETALRRKISDVSEKLEFHLSSIGSVRTGRINPEFIYADIDIQGSGELQDVIRFLAGLTKIEPQLAWRRLDLRPDNRFRRQQRGSSVNLAAQLNTVPQTRLNFNGTLRVLVYEGSLSVKELNITRTPESASPADSGREVKK